MSEYLIEIQDAIEAIQNIDWYHQNQNKDMVHGANPDEHQAWYKSQDIYEALNNVPIAHEETKTGYWINEGRFANYHGGNVYRCSRCGNRIIEKEPDDFCKHCGSDNRGGDYE